MRPSQYPAFWGALLALGACHHAPPSAAPGPQAGPARPANPTGGAAPPAGVPSGRPAGLPQGAPQDTTQRPGGVAGFGQPPEPSPRPYNRVITPDAKSKDGLFRTHRIGSRLLYEIPRRELGREMLLVPRTAKVTGFAKK